MTEKILKATHEGTMIIGDIKIECAYLEDGTRVLSQSGVFEAMGRSSLQGSSKSGSRNMPPFLAAKNLIAFIDKDLQAACEPFIYQPVKGGRAKGYRALILPKICDVYLKARDDKVLKPNQDEIAKSCEILLRSFAVLGFYVLHDEATGFIKDRGKFEYRELFKEFIRAEVAQYEKQFPDEFYDIFYKIYGYPRSAQKNRHPIFFAKLTRKYVYEPLAGSDGVILKMLDEKNPVIVSINGSRKREYKLFQFLEKIGKDALQQHMWQLIGIGKASPNKTIFDRNFNRTFSKHHQEDMFEE